MSGREAHVLTHPRQSCHGFPLGCFFLLSYVSEFLLQEPGLALSSLYSFEPSSLLP